MPPALASRFAHGLDVDRLLRRSPPGQRDPGRPGIDVSGRDPIRATPPPKRVPRLPRQVHEASGVVAEDLALRGLAEPFMWRRNLRPRRGKDRIPVADSPTPSRRNPWPMKSTIAGIVASSGSHEIMHCRRKHSIGSVLSHGISSGRFFPVLRACGAARTAASRTPTRGTRS